MFKVNNKDTRTIFIVNFEHFTHFSSISGVDLKQINVRWEPPSNSKQFFEP